MSRLALLLAAALAGCVVGAEDELETPQGFSGDWGPYAPKPGHPTVDDRDAFVAEVSAYAREAESLYGTPAAAVTAMACNESGFGWTKIAIYANNLFGWKWRSGAAGGRPPWTLSDQPEWDPNNKYVHFYDRRDAVLFVARKLATTSRYAPHTARYLDDLASGIDIRPATERWVYGIAYAGYNPYEHYPRTTIEFINNYRTPSATYSPQFNLYSRTSGDGGGEDNDVWVSIDTPGAGVTVSGDVVFSSSTGGGSVTSVKFSTRPAGATDWFALGEDFDPPYSRSWSTDPWVNDGPYELKAEAFTGATRRATGIIQVHVDNTP